MRSSLAVVALALLLVSCGSSDEGSGELATIRGTVLLGPTCPVENVASSCPDQPLGGVEVRAFTSDGSVETSAVSRADGGFVLEVIGGDYVLRAVVDEPGRSTKPVPISVAPGGSVRVTVPVDSGIR